MKSIFISTVVFHRVEISTIKLGFERFPIIGLSIMHCHRLKFTSPIKHGAEHYRRSRLTQFKKPLMLPPKLMQPISKERIVQRNISLIKKINLFIQHTIFIAKQRRIKQLTEEEMIILNIKWMWRSKRWAPINSLSSRKIPRFDWSFIWKYMKYDKNFEASNSKKFTEPYSNGIIACLAFQKVNDLRPVSIKSSSLELCNVRWTT